MASHSEHGRVWGRIGTAIIGTYGPVSAAACRDALVNNPIHLQDVSTQEPVNLTFASGEYAEIATSSSTFFQLLDSLPVMHFPLPISPTTGNSVLVVPRLSVSIGAAGTATFRVRIAIAEGEDLIGDPAFGTGIATVAEDSTTSTSATAIDFDSIYIPAAVLAGASRRSAPSLRASGALGSGRFVEASLTVWAKTSGSQKARVHAVYARTHCGA